MRFIFFKLFSFCLLGHFFSIDENAFSEPIKGVFISTETSLSIQKEQDTILEIQYKKATALFENKKYAEGLKLGLVLYEKTKNNTHTRIHYDITHLIAKIHKKTRNHKKAVVYYKRLINLLTINSTDTKDLKRYHDIDFAKNFLRLGAQYQLLKLNDSAIFYYEKLAEINSLDDEILRNLAVSYTNLSAIYQKDSSYTNHFEKAIDYAAKAIQIHKKRNKKRNQASAINNLANVYLLQGDFEKAKIKYFEGIKLIRRDTSTKAIRIKANLYYNLAWSMRNLKEYKAYDNLEISLNMENKLRDLEMQEMLERVTTEYNINTVRQEEELKRQLVINQKQKAERNLWITGISSISIIFILGFFLKQFRLRQKNLSLELAKQELIQQQKIEKIKSKSQIRILNATIDAKETERKQIAETLHDHVSTLLSSASLHLQAYKKIFNGSTPVELDKSQTIINEASQKIRDLSHTLVSSILLKFGLGYAIKDMAEKYSNYHLEILYETKYIQRYEQGFEIKLYNIIQEFVNNILKHSEATNAKILLVEKKNKLYLSVQDNGKGFDKSQIIDKNGLGINQIHARIHVMKGKFVIESQKGKGTLIKIELPIKKRKLIS